MIGSQHAFALWNTSCRWRPSPGSRPHLIGSRSVMTISIVGQNLQALMSVTSSDTWLLTREPANHHARSLICILWWKKAVNLEKPLTRGGEEEEGGGYSFHCCLKAGDRPAACLCREFEALMLSFVNIYYYMYSSQAVSAGYMEMAVHCSDTG